MQGNLKHNCNLLTMITRNNISICDILLQSLTIPYHVARYQKREMFKKKKQAPDQIVEVDATLRTCIS